MKILLVDNNPTVLQILGEFIARELRHEVRTAGDGLAALHLLDQFVPDVVITDLVMPNIGGDKLCRIIRETPHLSHCFLIILSAIAAEERSTACGADACIAKGRAGDVKAHLKTLLARAGRRKSDTLYEMDLTLGLDQVHDREVTRELLNSRNYFAGIVDYLEEGIFGLSRDGHIIYLNRAAARLAGNSEAKLLGREFVALFSEKDRAAIRRGLQEANGSPAQEPLLIDNDPPLNLNGTFVALRCLPLEVEGQRAIVVILRDQSARVLGQLFSRP